MSDRKVRVRTTVTYMDGTIRRPIPPQIDYDVVDLPNGNCLLSANGKSYELDANDVPEYLTRGNLKSVGAKPFP